jgi:hypothetical protein
MGKNSQIHLFLETEVFESLKKEAKSLEIPLAKLCRKKLGECTQLNRIETKLEEIRKKLNKKHMSRSCGRQVL